MNDNQLRRHLNRERKIRSIAISILLAIFLASLLWLLFGCGGNAVLNAQKTLKTAAITRNTSLKIAGDMYRRGDLTEAGRIKLITAGDTFRDYYLQAVDALVLYVKLDMAFNRQDDAHIEAEKKSTMDKLWGLIDKAKSTAALIRDSVGGAQ